MRRFIPISRARLRIRNRAPWATVFSHSFLQFHENDLFTAAAAMSYFGLLTLFPALLVLLAASNQVAAVSKLLMRVVDVYPGSGDFLEKTVRSLSNVHAGVVASCVVVVLWAGSWVFAVLERAVNRIWETRPRRFLHGRLLTLGMIGVVGSILAASVLTTSLLVLLRQLAARLPLRVLERMSFFVIVGDAFWQLVFALVSVGVTITLFLFVYRLLPSGRVMLHDCWPGAVVAGFLWEAAKYIFAWSLQYFHYDQIYGSVGAVVAVLTWGYVSSLILLYGAQLSAVLHTDRPAHTPTQELDAPSVVPVHSETSST
ncbi:MAG: YihY/virulence factor BrkB family protein [Pyrinomonadaceae bacterium]|nr:YihY/virulence factor BrkB family protein [Pyrinomonadaceae bacterium]